MEKEQSDSLATVAVISEKMPQTHSHYAPSEVYSTTEPPPAYMRPPMKSTAVQIARIAGITLITMSVVLGSFILAASWVQARASCTPEAIAAMQAELKLQQQQAYGSYQPQGEFLKHLQPEALVQEPVESKDSLQSLAAPTKKEVDSDTKDIKTQGEGENSSKSDSENGDRDDDDDDYDDDEFPPVHIKLPLQLDLDDIAGTLIQQARSRVSCVVERRRADEVMDGTGDNGLDNSTDPQRFQRLSGERVAILCESGSPNQEQQEQEMLTPIIVPLGTVQIPLQSQEPNPGYHQYQIHTQYQVPDMQQLPLSDPRGLNHIPPGVLPPELRNLPQLTMEMRPPRMGPQPPMGPQNNPMGPQIDMRQIPIELRHFPMDPMRGMRPMAQEPRQEPQQISMVYQQQAEQGPNTYNQEQGPAMMPPPPPQAEAQEQDPRMQQIPPMMIPQTEQRPPVAPQATPEKPRSPFQGIPIEIRRIIQQVPLEIKNIIQHITGEVRAIPVQVPEGARREELKPFPEGARPIPFPGPFPLPVEVRNLIEHGNIEGRQRPDGGEEQQETKPFPGPEDDSDEERNFPIPMEIRNIIHQVVEGRAFPVPRIALRPVKSMEVPVEAHAEVTDDQSTEQQQPEHREQEQQQAAHLISIQQHQQQQQQQQQQHKQRLLQQQQQQHLLIPSNATATDQINSGIQNIDNLLNNTVAPPNVSLQRSSVPDSQVSPGYGASVQMASGHRLAHPYSHQSTIPQHHIVNNNYNSGQPVSTTSRLSPHSPASMLPFPHPQPLSPRVAQGNYGNTPRLFNVNQVRPQQQVAAQQQLQQQQQRSMPSPGTAASARQSPFPAEAFPPPTSPTASQFPPGPNTGAPNPSAQYRLQRTTSTPSATTQLPGGIGSPRHYGGVSKEQPLLSPSHSHSACPATPTHNQHNATNTQHFSSQQHTPMLYQHANANTINTADMQNSQFCYDRSTVPLYPPGGEAQDARSLPPSNTVNHQMGGNVSSEFVRQKLITVVGARTQQQQQQQQQQQRVPNNLQNNLSGQVSQDELEALGLTFEMPSAGEAVVSDGPAKIWGSAGSAPSSSRITMEEARGDPTKSSLLQKLLQSE